MHTHPATEIPGQCGRTPRGQCHMPARPPQKLDTLPESDACCCCCCAASSCCSRTLSAAAAPEPAAAAGAAAGATGGTGGITCCHPLRLIQACRASRIHWCLSWPPAAATGTCRQREQPASKHAGRHAHIRQRDVSQTPGNPAQSQGTMQHGSLPACLLLPAVHQAKPVAVLAAFLASVVASRMLHSPVSSCCSGRREQWHAAATACGIPTSSYGRRLRVPWHKSALTHARLRCGYSGHVSSSSATLITNMCARQRPWCRFLLWDCLLLAKGKVPTSGSCSPGGHADHGVETHKVITGSHGVMAHEGDHRGSQGQCPTSQQAAAQPVSRACTTHTVLHVACLCCADSKFHSQHIGRQDGCCPVSAWPPIAVSSAQLWQHAVQANA